MKALNTIRNIFDVAMIATILSIAIFHFQNPEGLNKIARSIVKMEDTQFAEDFLVRNGKKWEEAFIRFQEIVDDKKDKNMELANAMILQARQEAADNYFYAATLKVRNHPEEAHDLSMKACELFPEKYVESK